MDTQPQDLTAPDATPVPSPVKRRGRGPGKKPRMESVNIRLPKDIWEFFDLQYGENKQAQIRAVLINYVNASRALLGVQLADTGASTENTPPTNAQGDAQNPSNNAQGV